MRDDDRCLFCRGSLDTRGASAEHLIPHALGGWLATRHVCKPCNDYFGRSLDRVVDHDILLGLRKEVGLRVRRDEVWEFTDPTVGARISGKLADDGAIRPVSPVWIHEGRMFIRAESEEETREIARKYAERLQREGRSVSFADLEQAEPKVVRMNIGLRDARSLNDLLNREAAKIAIEYISEVAAPEIALLAELDTIREFACGTSTFDGARTVYLGPSPFVRLPRTNRALFLPEEDWSPSQEEADAMMDQLAPEPADGSTPSLDQIPAWPGFIHRLDLKRDQDGTHLDVTLFTAIMTTIALPSGLPLPWGCFDEKDLISGAIQHDRP